MIQTAVANEIHPAKIPVRAGVFPPPCTPVKFQNSQTVQRPNISDNNLLPLTCSLQTPLLPEMLVSRHCKHMGWGGKVFESVVTEPIIFASLPRSPINSSFDWDSSMVEVSNHIPVTIVVWSRSSAA